MKYKTDRDDLSTFASRVRYLRRVKNISQIDAAKALNVHRTAYTKYETDNAKPGIDCMRDMAVLFDVSLDYLMDLSDHTWHDETVESKGMEDTEIALLAEFRRLNKTQRRRVVDMVIAIRRGEQKIEE